MTKLKAHGNFYDFRGIRGHYLNNDKMIFMLFKISFSDTIKHI